MYKKSRISTLCSSIKMMMMIWWGGRGQARSERERESNLGSEKKKIKVFPPLLISRSPRQLYEFLSFLT